MQMLVTRHRIIADDEYDDDYTTASRDFRGVLGRLVVSINEVVDEIKDWVDEH